MKLVAFALASFGMITALPAAPSREVAPLTSSGDANCAIFCDRDEALSLRTATKLADYLFEQTAVKPPVLGTSDLKSSDPHQTLIVIDGSANQTLLTKVDVTADIPADRNDAYDLKVVHHPDHWIIAAAGRSPAGAKFATYRLMEEMQIDHAGARIGPIDLRASPFFKTRSVSLFNIWRCPVDVVRQLNLESWPAEKIARSIDTYDAFGFNAVETHDRFHEDFLKAVYGITRAQWRDKVYALCDRAHLDGMTVFLRLWGNAVALPVKELKGGYTPFGFVNLAPDIPAEKKRWDAEIRDYASKNYAAHIDYLIGHWADASGVHPGSSATVKDAMLLHNELVAAFRAINPKLQSAFNLWGMAHPRNIRGWPGYEDHRSVSDAGILPKDVCVAQTTRAHSIQYSEQETADILASGRPAAVWTWRRADTEVRFGDCGLRIRIHDVVGDYFHHLPDSARQLQWHNIERNHHGLANDVNYYIVGKLMWDPKTDVDAALDKYCQLVFGPANAKAMAEAFDTIEMARDVEKQVSKEVIAHPADAARRAHAAFDAVSRIHLPDGFHSRLPSVVTPQEMLAQVRDTLAVIAANADLAAGDLPKLDTLLKDGKSTEAAALAATLQAKSDAWFGTVAGGVEGLWLKETLRERFPTQSSPHDGQRSQPKFLTHDVASVTADEDEAGVTIASAKKAQGLALLDLKPNAAPATPIEFRFKFKSTGGGKSHNGGLAFGPTDTPGDLVRCQALLGIKSLQIDGGGVTNFRQQFPDLNPDAEHQCVVRVDPTAHTITFTVDGSSVKADYQGDPAAIKYYGYVVERTTAWFSPIDVKTARAEQ